MDSLLWQPPDAMTTRDPSGALRTVTPSGTIDRSNPFFQSIGTNGRSCASCHVQKDAWSVSASDVQARFEASNGTDPLFRPVDGANSPLADVSTEAARRQAYSMLLKYGDIRIQFPIPDNAQFRLTAVDDPYGYANADGLSLFRRPLPATNLRFLTAVMWDGRATQGPFQPPMDVGRQHDLLVRSLRVQARRATLGHAEAQNPPSPEQLNEIVRFEMHLTTAQVRDWFAGRLDGRDAVGGPRVLANQRFYVGINDPLGAEPTGATFNPKAIRLFEAWSNPRNILRAWARKAVSRGEVLFNTLPIDITGVAGLNDVTGNRVIHGHCSTCHNAPNVGDHSVGAPLNIGISAASRRTPDMPLYTLTNIYTGESKQTTDPGLALMTGNWADIGKFKGPKLRGLAARAPYFHNGSAATLGNVIDFYNQRFGIGITAQQRHDLVAFLRSL